MKTSNKILIGLVAILLLLWISFIIFFKMNTVPYEGSNDISYMMGDIEGLKSNGPFNVRVVQYDGKSQVNIESTQTVTENYAVNRDNGTGILKLSVYDTAAVFVRADAKIKMKKCNYFELGGSTEMHFANPVKEDVIDFILKDNSKTDVNLEADSIHMIIGDKAEVHMEGKVRILHLTIDSSGTFDGTALEADEIIINMNDNADAALNPLKKISGKISNKDNLRMNNAPAVLEVEGF